jgi:hypothetical protein
MKSFSKGILLVCLVLIGFCSNAQRYAVASTAWSSTSTWSTSRGGAAGASVPTAADDVYLDGFSVIVSGGTSAVCNNLYFRDAVNSIRGGAGTNTLSISGELAVLDVTDNYVIPVNSVIQGANSLTFIFRGISIDAVNPDGWSTTARIRRATFAPGVGNTINLPDFFVANDGVLTVSSGTLNLTGDLQGGVNTSIIVNAGAGLLVSSGSISQDGTNSTQFPSMTVNGGAITSQGNMTSFINVANITINANSFFTVGYNGTNQTEGWWYQTTRPTSISIDPTSSVNFSAAANQSIYTIPYGNLVFGGSGTKSVSGTGSVNVAGNFSFSNAGVTYTSSQLTIFDGSGTQIISGSGTANFNGGLQMNKSAGNLTLSQSINIQNGLTLNSGGTLVLGTNTVNLSGNLVNDATITRGSSTLNINGTTVVSGSVATSLNNLTISGTGNFTAPASLNVGGNFTNNGTYNANSGTLVFDGTAAQGIGGTTQTNFYDVTITNPTNVTVNTVQNVTGILTVSNGTLFASGRLVLVSNSAGDAMVAPIGSGATIQNQVIVQRYLPNTNSSRSYRFIAPPVNNSNVSDWKAWFPITGTFNDPSTVAEWPAFPSLVQASPSLFFYNEPKGGTVDGRYDSYPLNGTVSTSASLTNGRGYAAFIRQTTPITLTTTGFLSQGNNVNVPVTASGAGVDDGWNLIGNPYPAPINWDNVTIPSGVGAQISFKDNTGNVTTAGGYVTFTQGTPGVGIPGQYEGTIPMGQAFFVRATSNATITFREDDKQTIRNPVFIRKETIDNLLRVYLSGASRKDELVIRLAENARDEADYTHDAFKLQNDFLNVSSLSADGKRLAINSMSPFETDKAYVSKSFPLSIEGGTLAKVATGLYRINFGQVETFGDDVRIVLKDALLKDSVTIANNTASYSFTITEEEASFKDRFTLIVSRTNVITALGDSTPKNVSIFPNPTEGIFTIELPKTFKDHPVTTLNSLGVEMGDLEMVEKENSLIGKFDLREQPSGVYFIKFSDNKKAYTKQVIKR